MLPYIIKLKTVHYELSVFIMCTSKVARQGIVFIGVCLFVCVCMCLCNNGETADQKLMSFGRNIPVHIILPSYTSF